MIFDMNFQQRLEDMLKEVDFRGQLVHKCRTAHDWEFDPRLGSYFEEVRTLIIFYSMFAWGSFLGIEVKKVEQLSNELILNSRNAVNSSPDYFIDYMVYLGQKGLVVRVGDEGPGFDHSEEVLRRKSLLRKISISTYFDPDYEPLGGTGVYTLLKFANDFAYNDVGNEVIAKFKPRYLKKDWIARISS